MTGKLWRKMALTGLGFMIVLPTHHVYAACETEFQEVCDAVLDSGWHCTKYGSAFSISGMGTRVDEEELRRLREIKMTAENAEFNAQENEKYADKHDKNLSVYLTGDPDERNAKLIREARAKAKAYRCAAQAFRGLVQPSRSNNPNNLGQTSNNHATSNSNLPAQSSDPIVNQHAFASLDAKKQKQLLADREMAGERKYRNMSDCVDYKNGYKGKGNFQHWMVNRCNVKVTYTFCWSGPGKHTCEDEDYGMWQIRPGGSDPFSGPPTYQGTKGGEYTIHYAACEYPGGALNKRWNGPGKSFSFDCK